MATSVKQSVVKESVTAVKAPLASKKPKKLEKPKTSKESMVEKRVIAKTASSTVKTVKTVLNPAAAWPFPTGPRP